MDLVVEEVEILTAVNGREDFNRNTCPIGMRSESLEQASSNHHPMSTMISIVSNYIHTTCNVLWFSLQATLALDIDTY